MNTVGVGAGSNLQFFNMVIPDMNATSGLARQAPADPAAFYNTPAQMAELAKEVGGAVLMGHSKSIIVPDQSRASTSFGLLPLDDGISL